MAQGDVRPALQHLLDDSRWEEFEVMFGRKPLSWSTGPGLEASDIRAEFVDLLEFEMTRTVIHFGEGRVNPSTIACVLAEVEQTLATRHGVLLPDSPARRARPGFMGI